jgi:hypothetical protein
MTIRFTIAVALGFAVFAGPGVANAQDWKTVTAKDGAFTIELPSEPDFTTTPVKTSDGKQEYIRHNYVSGADERAFVIQVATYPSSVNMTKPKVNLQSGLDAAAQQMEGGKWTDIRWTTYQGEPATDAVATKPPFQVRNFSVIKGRTLYTLTYAGPPGSANSADVNRFINSLAVKK